MVTAAEIHTDFKKSLDLNSFNNVSNPSIDLVDADALQCSLIKLGLSNSKTYKELSKNISNNDNIDNLNKDRELYSKISIKYTNYRLIGIKNILNLCEKYDLYLGLIDQFIGSIPYSNLQDLTKHKNEVSNSKEFTRLSPESAIDIAHYSSYGDIYYAIVAPRYMFKENLVEADRLILNIEKPKLKIKFEFQKPSFNLDPIVLAPLYNPRGYNNGIVYQIVTAWGEEAEDDNVINKIKITTNDN